MAGQSPVSPVPSVARTAAVQRSRPQRGNWLDELDSHFEEHSTPIVATVIALGLIWRLWLAQATFFNTDEAWHYSLSTRSSAWLAYKASLTISHPPLLILIEHVWRALGTSNLMLRLPSVIAGAAFCWIFYRWLGMVGGRAAAWSGLILAAFLWPMISTSAEVRQNPWLLLFSILAAYSFELALAKSSVVMMLASAASLYLAMLSHYAAFFVAAALGLYAIRRMWEQRPPLSVLSAWLVGQVGGVAVGAVLYVTHLGHLDSLLTTALLPQQYLSNSYFHNGQEHLLPFLFRGTFGIFRFIFGETQIGQFAAILFVAGLVILSWRKRSSPGQPTARALAFLCLIPFILNWLAASAERYPYGRTRQCMFLAIVALAGVSVCLARITRDRVAVTVALAAGIVVLCQAFGTLQDRDALPIADQRHQFMDHLVEFIRTSVGANDLIFTDQATSYQLRHYLCNQKPVSIETWAAGFQYFSCEGLRVVFTGPNEGALTAPAVDVRWRNSDRQLDLTAGAINLWVVQGGWASGLGEAMRPLPGLAQLDIHSFGRHLEAFKLPGRPPRPAQR